MNAMNCKSILRLMLAFAVLALLLAACQPAVTATEPPAATAVVATEPPAATQAAEQPTAEQPAATEPPAATAETPAEPAGPDIADLQGVAQEWTIETVAAVSADAGGPGWDVAPEHRVISLTGYEIVEHRHQPKIYIYPVAELGQFNPATGQIAADLQALLQSKQPGEVLPFLPIFNAAQVFHTNVKFLDFANGSGVRYVTMFSQGMMPISSYDIFYTFQGLTSDGKYYVAAVLPLNHTELPATDEITPEMTEKLNDYITYRAETVTWLNQEDDQKFSPNLAKLDALIQSLKVD